MNNANAQEKLIKAADMKNWAVMFVKNVSCQSSSSDFSICCAILSADFVSGLPATENFVCRRERCPRC